LLNIQLAPDAGLEPAT